MGIRQAGLLAEAVEEKMREREVEGQGECGDGLESISEVGVISLIPCR